MPITLLDGIVLVVMLISAGLAMIRGFVREVLSIASWVVAAFAAWALYGSLTPYALNYISSETVATAASIGAIFLVTLLVVSYITMRISDFVLDSRIGALDRTLGFVFGAARGFLLVVVAMLFFDWFVPVQKQPTWIVNAKSRPLLVSTGASLVAVLPEDPERAIIEQFRKQGAGGNQSSSGSNEETTYSSSERNGLDQLSVSGSGSN